MDLLVNGIIDFNWLEYTIYTIVVTQITIMSITLYLHRGITHSAIEIKGLLSHFFRFWLWLTTSMRTADWVAIHRKHHAKVETIDDPKAWRLSNLQALICNIEVKLRFEDLKFANLMMYWTR